MRNIMFAFIATFAASSAHSMMQDASLAPSKIEQVTLSPLFGQAFTCSQHWEGQLKYIGDARGQDCMVLGGFEVIAAPNQGFSKLYRTNGKKNEDWYGWEAPVLSPFDGIVKKVYVNNDTNSPGTLGKPPASILVIEREDGINVLYAHVQRIGVKVGHRVKAGQAVAVVGNNGFSRAPHIHVGAFKGKVALQVQWDLALMANIVGGNATIR